MKYSYNSKKIIGICVVLCMFLYGVHIFSVGSFAHIDTKQYQAVFLSNDQVYFGKLKTSFFGSVSIEDVYYLRNEQDLQNSAENNNGLNLVKLGGEIHGPEDVIFLQKDHVIFWENLKDDAMVVKIIHSKK